CHGLPEVQLDPRSDSRHQDEAWDRQRAAYLHCVRNGLDDTPTPPRMDAPTAFSENTAPPSTAPRTCRIWSSRCTTTRHSRSTPNANTSASPRNSPTVVRPTRSPWTAPGTWKPEVTWKA